MSDHEHIHRNVLISTSTVADGNMGFRFDDHEAVVANRRAFLAQHGIDFDAHVCMTCNHGDAITPVDWSNGGRGAARPEAMPEAEALVTNEPGLALMLLTADCIPGVFFDPIKAVIALAHLNRKTIAHDLAARTVGYLRDHFGTDPKDLMVHFGPHIKKASYHFTLPLKEDTPHQLAPFIERGDGRAYVDMERAYRAQLTACGITAQQIAVSPIDTATSPEYFSHYRSMRNPKWPDGRMATIAMICDTPAHRADRNA